jgi:hypothetical protein
MDLIYSLRRGMDSVVGIATGYELDDRGVGFRVPVGSSIFSFPCRPYLTSAVAQIDLTTENRYISIPFSL